MTDDELKELRAANAELLREKAEAVKAWHEEIRRTLAQLSLEVATIKSSISGALAMQDRLEKLESRLKAIEDFKLKAIGIFAGAFMVLSLLWKLIDKWA